jgi:carbamoyltransferase
LVAAAQEERFTRRKHDPDFPSNAIRYCLAEAGISVADLDAVAFYDKPFLKFERLLETYVSHAPQGFPSFLKAMPLWLKQKLWIPDLIRKELGYEGDLFYPEHHESHAASAFFPSPFAESAILTTDGVGEWATTSFGVGRGNTLELLAEQHFPHSLGLLYSAFTYFCGFRVNSGEYKLMGLAPYGEPRYVDLIRDRLIDLREDGSFRLHMDAFTFSRGLTMTGKVFEELFDGPARRAEAPLTQREKDLARSIQIVTEDAVLAMARHVHRETGQENLCMAGGVALNCVANGRLLREGPFRRVWFQPASGDAGGAVGAALATWHMAMGRERSVGPHTTPDSMGSARLGPAFSAPEIRQALADASIPDAAITELSAHDYRQVAQLLAEGLVVGWFQGRMEFGPRALGGRSILADPRGEDTQRRVNVKIKFRESFRPFAPSVLAERADEWFGLDGVESPYMLLVAPVLRQDIPAVTHVDGSARVQTVSQAADPRFHALLSAFEAETGCPVLVNTSFNVRGEPIVCTPADAIRCFLDTHMDILVLENILVDKRLIPGAASDIKTAEEIAAAHGLD